eukprot:192713-Rhodomonas_salina.4
MSDTVICVCGFSASGYGRAAVCRVLIWRMVVPGDRPQAGTVCPLVLCICDVIPDTEVSYAATPGTERDYAATPGTEIGYAVTA